jgi:hypothetical protein
LTVCDSDVLTNTSEGPRSVRSFVAMPTSKLGSMLRCATVPMGGNTDQAGGAGKEGGVDSGEGTSDSDLSADAEIEDDDASMGCASPTARVN